MRVVVLFVLMAGAAMANFIVTADPSTSPAWPVGTSFEPGEVSQTTDPLGPFSGTSIQFEGFDFGGSPVSLNGLPCSFTNACLVFNYDLNSGTPAALNSIVFTGDAFNGATFELLNSTGTTVLDSLSVSSGNVGHVVTYSFDTAGIVGTSFDLELFDTSSTWTYVSDIQINSTPEPQECLLLVIGLGLIVWVSHRRRGVKA
jgi:hypothetical protein